MPRIQPRILSFKYKKQLLEKLWTMVALLESRDEIENFFKDLLSDTEAIMLARRIEIAQLLLQGKGYDQISEELGAGPNTIASVHRWLQKNTTGYQKLIPRLEKENRRISDLTEQNQKSKKPFSLEWMKKKYPLHFLILHTIDQMKFKPPKKLR